MTIGIALESRGGIGLAHVYSGAVMSLPTEKPKRAPAMADVSNQQYVDLVARIRDRQDRTAFAELFRHFAPRVKAFLMKSGASESLADECTQEVMATLWTKAHMFDPARASVSTWVFTVARNRKIDAFRKMRRPEPEDLTWGPEAEPDQADVLALQQESEKLTKAISELPDKQRDLIERAYFGDLSHSEIAEETGLPLGTIKSRIRLGLERLRHAMEVSNK
ncbi:MAG: sigma-70 family RNA polymerase sigma factor [Erythrobacter sp.]|nr:sigma-70 family RNA polymerase sigma factor [Erythrobacter sp.]NNL34470.1 sigma-70 family RNA polymerase sigma factor [Silicimonas sp.]NNL73278.1 sigma-70 family RNA polymerase sigma factor [Silicimonas sp.]